MKQQLISVKAAAKILNVTPITIRRWCRSGKIKPYALVDGKVRIFDKKEVRKLNDRERVKSISC